MKKALIALGVLLVIIGVVIVAIAGGEEGFLSLIDSYAESHDFSLATNGKEYSAEEANSLQSVTIAAKDFSVYIRKSSDNTLSVKFPELKSGDVVTYSSQIDKDGILSVTQDNKHSFNMFWGKRHSSFMIISLPESKTQLEISVKDTVGFVCVTDLTCDVFKYEGKTGGLSLESCAVARDFAAVSTTGAINLKKCNMPDVKLTATTGAVHCDELTCINLTAETDTGVISAKEVNIEKAANVQTATGLITFEGKAPVVDLSTNTGAINFNVTSDKLEVETSTGAINGKIHGDKADYNIAVKNNVGSCNLTDQNVGGSKSLKAKVSTGSIKIDFVK